jgi:ATP-dependent RNA helicase RhlE
LAAQINREFALLSRNTSLRAALVVGGESMSRQVHDVRAGAQVLIACPGRLIDHLERGTVRLDRVNLVVIDEADRMLDMGFLPQLRTVLRTVRKARQTLMFSATMSPEVERVAREFLSQPNRVSVGETRTPPVEIRQAIFPVTMENKGPLLMELLKGSEVNSAIVFTRTKSRADRIARMLVRSRFKAVAIHGGRSQNQRNAALAGFRKGDYSVLVATDVAARGLDIPDVTHVVNFDLPEESDTYIHRIGRTARMGRSGQALSLVMPEEGASLHGIERTLGVRLERVSVAGFHAPDIAPHKQEVRTRPALARHRPARPGRRETYPSTPRKGISLGNSPTIR